MRSPFQSGTASAERVFNAWLDAGQFASWMGPRGVIAKTEVLALDAREGGGYQIAMHKGEAGKLTGDKVVITGTYREVTRFTKLAFTWSWEGRGCNCDSGTPTPTGDDTLVTLTFRSLSANRTEMTLVHENFSSIENRDSHNGGWNACLEQLEQLPSRPRGEKPALLTRNREA